MDILSALKSLLKTVKEINKLSTTSLTGWPTYAATLTRSLQKKMVTQFISVKCLNVSNKQSHANPITVFSTALPSLTA